MYAIYKKELRNYFLTPIAYVFMAPFIAFTAIYFVMMLSYQTVSMSYIVSSTNMLCLFIVPILTMQLFAEERNKKTEQLLITAPVNVSSIVMGKYFAAVSVFLITLAVSLIFPVILFAMSTPSLSEVIALYLGVILLWSAFISVGVFISSLTESQVISAILTFAALFVLYSIDSWTLSITSNFAKQIINMLAVFTRYSDFEIGLVSLSNVIYYLSFIFVFLFLTVRNIEKRRYS